MLGRLRQAQTLAPPGEALVGIVKPGHRGNIAESERDRLRARADFCDAKLTGRPVPAARADEEIRLNRYAGLARLRDPNAIEEFTAEIEDRQSCSPAFALGHAHILPGR
jgi:hypothetical protein